jgi:hypothetical protein
LAAATLATLFPALFDELSDTTSPFVDHRPASTVNDSGIGCCSKDLHDARISTASE